MAEINIKTKEEFDQQVLNSELSSLVDFWAPWCSPCQLIAPDIEDLAHKYEGKINVVKINIDEAKDLASRYEVMSIPNLIFFKDGKKVEQIIGSVEKEKIKDAIDNKLL